MKRYDLAAHYPPRGSDTKAHYKTIGMMEQRDDGTFRIKIDTIPVGPGWGGWINVFEKTEKPTAQKAFGDARPEPPLQDDIPF